MSESIRLQEQVHKIISLLKSILHNTRNIECCVVTPQGGTGSAPSGLTSITVTQTGTGNVVITPAGGTAYTLTAQGQVYTITLPSLGKLPAFTISGTSTWAWYGV